MTLGLSAARVWSNVAANLSAQPELLLTGLLPAAVLGNPEGNVETDLAHESCCEEGRLLRATRLSRTGRRGKMGGAAHRARRSTLDRDPVVAFLCSRGQSARRERQMGIEKSSGEVSVSDGAPRLRPGQRPDGGLGLR